MLASLLHQVCSIQPLTGLLFEASCKLATNGLDCEVGYGLLDITPYTLSLIMLMMFFVLHGYDCYCIEYATNNAKNGVCLSPWICGYVCVLNRTSNDDHHSTLIDISD